MKCTEAKVSMTFIHCIHNNAYRAHQIFTLILQICQSYKLILMLWQRHLHHYHGNMSLLKPFSTRCASAVEAAEL